MSDNKITIVTGFFDCNRDNHKTQKRSVDKYFDYFEFWSRLDNDMIIFGNQDTINRALNIRKKFGRLNKTYTVCIDNFTNIEPDIYSRMRRVEQINEFKQWRIRDYDISNEATYDYVMFLKSWMLYKASLFFNDERLFAWIDFGFNHGGDYYTNPEDFNFTWSYNFNIDKIHLFTLGGENSEIGFLKLMLMTDQIIGSVVCHSSMCKQFFSLMKESITFLTSIDLIDDDQMLMTISYRRNPDIFELHKSGWFSHIKDYGGSHLRFKENIKAKSFLQKTKSKKITYIFQYIYSKAFYGMTVEQNKYRKRLNRLIKYYK